jgi:hypothetical protein
VTDQRHMIMRNKPIPSLAERMDDAEFERLRVWNIRYGEWSAPGEISLVLDALIAEARRARQSEAEGVALLNEGVAHLKECDAARIAAEARVETLEEALREIAISPHSTGDTHGDMYGIGVQDGHRCAATIAASALKEKP